MDCSGNVSHGQYKKNILFTILHIHWRSTQLAVAAPFHTHAAMQWVQLTHDVKGGAPLYLASALMLALVVSQSE